MGFESVPQRISRNRRLSSINIQDGPLVASSPIRKKGHSSGGFFSWIWSVATWPICIGYKIFIRFVGLGLKFVKFVGLNRFIRNRFISKDGKKSEKGITQPVDEVIDFISEYERKHGTNHPVFHAVI